MCTPKGSPFARELGKLINQYKTAYLDLTPGATSKPSRSSSIHVIEYDTFRELVPYSQLAAELVTKFIKMPAQAFDAETQRFQDWYFDVSGEELRQRRESCMHSADADESKSEAWRRSRQLWNQMRGSQEEFGAKD